MPNVLYYGDNLKILRKYIPNDSIDLIYLDPPFNSKASYNVLFREPTGKPSEAQITAFEDTWHWGDESERTFKDIITSAPANVVDMMTAFRKFIHENDMMAYLTMMCPRLIELHKKLKGSGSLYLHCDPTASHYLKILMDAIFGGGNFRNEIIWFYTNRGGRPKTHFAKKHQTLLFYSKTDDYYFDGLAVGLKRESKDKEGTFGGYFKTGEDGKRYQEVRAGGKVYVYDMDSLKIPEDVWCIQHIPQRDKTEYLGYDTQKPEALLEYVIKASSKKGMVILDPFCGCGTALVVAQRLGCEWIGIDITHLAITEMKWRLERIFHIIPKKDYSVVGEPEDLAGAQELAKQNKYQFQWWAVSLIKGQPYGDKKKGADTGIDGYVYFMDEKDKVKKAIVSVKGGGTSVKDIRDLRGVIDREGAEIGIFITLEAPTQPMVTEAASRGFYTSPIGKDYQRIQIFTIEELLQGKQPDIPLWVSPMPLTSVSKGVNKKATPLL